MPAPTPPGAALKPAELAAPVVRAYEQATDELLINIARHFSVMDPELATADWQFRKLAELGQLRKENIEIIAKYVGGNRETITAALQRAARTAISDIETSLRAAAERGLIGSAAFKPEASPRIRALLEAYQEQALNAMNLVNTTMLQSSLAAYTSGVTRIQFDARRALEAQEALNTAAGQAVLGAETRASVVRKAISNMSKKGLTGYIDRAGREWTPEAYVDMDIRTTMHNAYRQAVWDRNADYGNDLVYAQAKAVSRPGCYPWQNVIISTSGVPRVVPDLNGNPVKVVSIHETTYGEPAGLWGINCGHSCNVFIPGMSLIRGEAPPEDQNQEAYEISQTQRSLERNLRAAKREAMMADATGDEKAFEEAAKRVKANQEALSKHLEANGRIGLPKTGVVGYDKRIADKVRAVKVADDVKLTGKAAETASRIGIRGVEYNPVKKLSERRTVDEIVAALGGGDMTKGSCASLGLAYIGQKNGYDVLDFRGGASRSFFASKENKIRMWEALGVNVDTERSFSSNLENGAALLKRTKLGKEYYLSVGRHAAIIRRTEEGALQYLELQDSRDNGWHMFSQDVVGTLKRRFVCSSEKNGAAVMVDTAQVNGPEFARILGFINTQPEKQWKGVTGFEK